MAAQTIIDDQQVLALINNPNMRRKFPFLATAYMRMNGKARGSGGCGGCAGKRKANGGEYADIRKAIGTMSVAQKAVFKQAVGGKQIVVKYPVRPGKIVKLTF